MLAAGWLAKRLPGPLGSLSRWLVSGLSGERGFRFWWLAVTLGVALIVGALLALLVSPVAAVIALLVVGIWALVRRARNKEDDEHRSEHGDEDGTASASESGSGERSREPSAASSTS